MMICQLKETLAKMSIFYREVNETTRSKKIVVERRFGPRNEIEQRFKGNSFVDPRSLLLDPWLS